MLAFIYNFLLFAAESSASHGGDSNGFAHFWNTYFNYPGFELWRFLNLGIFVAIMVYLLRKPLTNAFKAKRETIRAELIKAEEERQAALAQLTATEAKLSNLNAESAGIIERARQEAEAEKTRIAEQTEFETNKLREQAQQEIDRTSKLTQIKLRRFSAEESIRLAEEKIKKDINADKDANLIKAGVQAIGGLN